MHPIFKNPKRYAIFFVPCAPINLNATMIKKVAWNGIPALAMKAGRYEALLVPQVGANLVRLCHTGIKADILRTPQANEMETFFSRPQIFGLPLLFPPNRISNGTYTWNGRTYRYPITLPDQHCHHHGLLKTQPFTVTRCEEGDEAVVVEASFCSNDFNDAIFSYFPHRFVCRMVFNLSDQGLTHKVIFENLDDAEMPLGVGFHTPINVPFVAGSDPAACRLRLSAGKQWLLSPDRTLPTGEIIELSDELGKLRTPEGMRPTGSPLEALLTDCAIETAGKPYHGAIMTDTANGLQLFYEVDENVKFWTLWNNGGGVPWICPEPQTWAIDAPNVKMPHEVTGFRTLAPKSTWEMVSKFYMQSL